MNPGYWGWGKMMYLCKKQVGENMNLWPRTKKIHVGCSRLEVLSLTAVRCFKQNGCQMKNRNSVTVPVITIWIFSFLSLWCTCKTPSEGESCPELSALLYGGMVAFPLPCEAAWDFPPHLQSLAALCDWSTAPLGFCSLESSVTSCSGCHWAS